MKKNLITLFLAATILGGLSISSANCQSLYMGIQPTSVTVSYGATAEQIQLQFYIVNQVSTQQPLTDYQLTPVGSPSAAITVNSITNTCNGILPPAGQNGICNIFVNLTAKGNQSTNPPYIPGATYTFSFKYGGRQTTFTSSPFTFSFATGTPLPSAMRTFTFVNNCSTQDVYLGIASGATNSIKPDPSVVPVDLQSCTDTVHSSDCYPGSQCINVQPSPVLNHCFWNDPTPPSGPNPYFLVHGGGNTTVKFPVYDNGIDIVWNGGIAARVNCTGNSCQIGDCGGVVSGVVGGCTLGGSFAAPITQVEFTLEAIQALVTTTSGYPDVDTYDVTVINGITIPISMKPTNGTWGGPNKPYTCATPGAVTQPAPLGGCNWTGFTPPNTDNNYDYIWVTSGGVSCGASNPPCSTGVCGHSFTGATVDSQATCGTQLGYWTADAVCAIDSTYGAPFNCNTTFTQTDGTNYLLSQLYGCSTGELKHSCYTAGATSTCCGCQNWGEVGATIPPTTQLCGGLNPADMTESNPNWKTNVLNTLKWIKTQCPTVYTYPYDDASSTFTCQTLNSANVNVTDYTITFCPST